MKIENCGGKYGDRLILSFQENESITPEKVETSSRSLDSEESADRKRYEAVLARTRAALVEAAESARAEADRRR